MKFRGVMIRVPHDTIRISIQRSQYDMYLDTYLSTVRCQRDAVSSMKTETPVIRSTAHNLLLQWMEYLLLQLPLVGRKHDFAQLFQVYIRLFPSTWSEKNMFWLILFKNSYAYSFMWIAIQWVCCIDTYRSDKIPMHRDASANRYTPNQVGASPVGAAPTSNYIFILDLTSDFNGLRKNNCKEENKKHLSFGIWSHL